MPGNIGWQGLIVVLIVLLIIFGPKRLPELGRSLGRGMREFKDTIAGRGDDDDDEDTRALPPPAGEDDERVTAGSARERDPV